MAHADQNRRPLKTRSSQWARRVAGFLVSTDLSPDQISVLSIVVAAVGAGVLLLAQGPWALIVCAVCIQLRLACNMLDGMVAVEGGKKSPVGSLYNEIPDRLADSIFLVAVGYAVQLPWLGWCAALLAAFTAYIRVLGGSLGFAQDFRGPMAKPHRMAALTLGCLLGAAEEALWGTHHALVLALALIAAGSALTCATRTGAIANALRARLP